MSRPPTSDRLDSTVAFTITKAEKQALTRIVRERRMATGEAVTTSTVLREMLRAALGSDDVTTTAN